MNTNNPKAGEATLRDYFAASAVQSVIADNEQASAEAIAKRAGEIADAMLAERRAAAEGQEASQ